MKDHSRRNEVRALTVVATLEPSEYLTSMLGTGWDGVWKGSVAN